MIINNDKNTKENEGIDSPDIGLNSIRLKLCILADIVSITYKKMRERN